MSYWHDDLHKAFGPLLDHVRQSEQNEDKVNNLVGGYMYMGHDDDKTYYKNICDRSYFNIYHNGTTEGEFKTEAPEGWDFVD